MRILSILFATLILCTQFASAATTPFKMTSNVTADNGALPTLYTCDGKNISPQMTWQGQPKKTRSLALIVSDPDAPNGAFYHWVVFNIPPSTTTFAEGQESLPEPAKTGMNTFGKSGYSGPCPPRDTSHHYLFTLYALDKNLKLDNDSAAESVLNAMKGHVVAQTTFVAVYTRWQ